MQPSLSAVYADPSLLAASLRNKLVTRWQFLYNLASKGGLMYHDHVQFLGFGQHLSLSDHQFARQFDRPDLDLVYNDAHKQACWDRYIKGQLL